METPRDKTHDILRFGRFWAYSLALLVGGGAAAMDWVLPVALPVVLGTVVVATLILAWMDLRMGHRLSLARRSDR